MKKQLAIASVIALVSVIACSSSGATLRPCGTTACTDSEMCVHPCCGGAPPPCFPMDDAGVCPVGTSTTNQVMCVAGSGPCKPPVCTPDPPFCAPMAPNGPQGCVPKNGDCNELCA